MRPRRAVHLAVVALGAVGFVRSSWAGLTVYLDTTGPTVQPSTGGDDPVSNMSVVAQKAASIAPWQPGADALAAYRECLDTAFAPLDVTFTDVEPSSGDYVEVIVGGDPTAVGLDPSAGGVSPSRADCAPVDRAILFVFPDVFEGADDPVRRVCETTAIVLGSSQGLDHTVDPRDLMSTLVVSGPKVWLDGEVSCGDDEARACRCEGTTQNSYRALVDVVGAAPGQDGDGADGPDDTVGGGCGVGAGGAGSALWLLALLLGVSAAAAPTRRRGSGSCAPRPASRPGCRPGRA